MSRRPLRICFRLLGGDNWMGGVYYIHNLIRCLSELPEDERGALHLTLEHDKSAGAHVVPVAKWLDRTRARGKTSHYLRGGGRLLLSRLGRTLVSCLPRPYDFVYPAPVRGRALCNGAAWIPDFQYRHLPELFSESEIQARERTNVSIAQNQDRVVVSSEMAAHDFCRFYPSGCTKVRILRFASALEETWLMEDPTSVVRARGLPERFFLVSNQFWIHKNHALVIEAAGECHRRGVPVHIVFTGNFQDFRSDNYIDGLRRRISELGLDAHMHLLGQIPRQEQIQLFRASLAVIQPSKFEGWSTVIEDARALGKTVFMSDFPVHIEQSPPHSKVFGRSDSSGLASLMCERALDPTPGPNADNERRALVEGIERRRTVARDFLAIAREAMGHG